MPTLVVDTLKPKGVGGFPVVEASDVSMGDGTRLDEAAGLLSGELFAVGKRVTAVEKEVDEISVAYPLAGASLEIQPEKYYEFGEVGSLAVTLVEVDDNKAHEYYFEFIPTEDFTELTVTPTPKWVKEPQYPAGRTCQVSILRGIGVMVSA